MGRKKAEENFNNEENSRMKQEQGDFQMCRRIKTNPDPCIFGCRKNQGICGCCWWGGVWVVGTRETAGAEKTPFQVRCFSVQNLLKMTWVLRRLVLRAASLVGSLYGYFVLELGSWFNECCLTLVYLGRITLESLQRGLDSCSIGEYRVL